MTEPQTPAAPVITETVRTWTMLFITVVFVLLYGLTVIGVVTAANAMQNLQPIVFVIIGYFFGRLPSAKVESFLKEQVAYHANAETAAKQAEKKAAENTTKLEEKIDNALRALRTPAESAEGNYDIAVRILSLTDK